MTPEAQRIAIAEACGWRRWSHGDPFIEGQRFADTKFGGYVRRVERIYGTRGVTLDVDESPIYTPDRFGKDREYEPVNGWLSPKGRWKLYAPDYLNDLNAMNEAERVLTDTQWNKYCAWLVFICCRSANHRPVGVVASATAAQRAEAFLKTLGKWSA